VFAFDRFNALHPLFTTIIIYKQQDTLQGLLHISHERNMGSLYFIDLRSIDINVNDGSPRTEFFHLTDGPVVKTRSQGNKKINLVKDVVCIWSSMHTEHTEVEGVPRGKRT